MRRLARLAVPVLIALHPSLAFACGPTPPVFAGGEPGPEGGVSVSVGRIAEVIWVPLLIDGIAVPGDAGLSLTVHADGKVEGATGCNRFSGTAVLDAGAMEFGPLAVTEMACLDPEQMDREAAYLKALGEVRSFVAAPEGMWLTRADGTVALCLW